jgi:DNA-binding IscR family transcriptional regulator
MLSQKTRYSIRALQHLADTWRQGPVRLDAIAEAQNIPRKFLTVILSELVAMSWRSIRSMSAMATLSG